MFTTFNNIDIIPIPFKFVKTFLISYKSKYYLVDTGYPKDYLKLYNKISLITLDQELSNLKAIIITHHHSDHTGGIFYLKKINPEIRIIAHKNCFENLKKGSNSNDEKYFTCSKTIQRLTRLSHKLFKNSGRFEPYTKKDSDIEISDKDLFLNLEEDTLFDEGSFEKYKNQPFIKIFYTPGHTDDSICIKIDDHIIVGDTLASSFNIFGNRYLPIIFNDLKILYQSWEKILKEDVNTIIPSHGDSFDKNEVAKNINYFKKAYKI
ncbi:MAG: MBL fold metallo-hydrolase [Spirochaetota bacterium]